MVYVISIDDFGGNKTLLIGAGLQGGKGGQLQQKAFPPTPPIFESIILV